MSEPNATRVNVTNPFTDTRARHPEASSGYTPQQFDQQNNSYTYTLQPRVDMMYPQPQYLHGHKPYSESSYDEEDSDSSSQCSGECSGEDCSDESSLTDYHPSDKVRTYFSNQAEMQQYYNHLPQTVFAQPQYQPGFHSKANYHRVTTDEPQILSQKREAKYYPAPKAAGQESSPDQLSSSSSANDNAEPLQPRK